MNGHATKHVCPKPLPLLLGEGPAFGRVPVLANRAVRGWQRILTTPQVSIIPQSGLVAVKLRWTFRL